MIDWFSCPAVERDPERVSGAWVFRGTREPVTALFQNLEDGVQVSDFILWFPGVTLEPVSAVLEHAARSLEAAYSEVSNLGNRNSPVTRMNTRSAVVQITDF